MIRKILPAVVLYACFMACAGAQATAPAPASPRAGEVPPQLLGKDRAGNVVDLARQHGKVVIVTFWASWCGPCRKELPMLANLQQVVGDDALHVYAINWGESRRDINQLVRHRDWPKLDYLYDPRGELAKQFGIVAVPHMFIIGGDGTLVHTHRGYSEASLPRIIDEIVAALPEEVRNRPPRQVPAR